MDLFLADGVRISCIVDTDACDRILDGYANWIDRCKKNGTLMSDTDTELLAAYIDAQMNLTMMRDARGDDRAMSREILRLALVNLV